MLSLVSEVMHSEVQIQSLIDTFNEHQKVLGMGDDLMKKQDAFDLMSDRRDKRGKVGMGAGFSLGGMMNAMRRGFS